MAKEFDVRKYNDYFSLSKTPTKDFLMISELIDNAIGSFDDENGGMDWSKDENKPLVVNVEMFFDGKNTEEWNGKNVETNSYIRVTDNAYGMTEARLMEAIKLNNINTDTVSDSHKHGRGLKQCAFHFGATLKVETHHKSGERSRLILDNKAHELTDPVELETVKLKDDEKFDVLDHVGTSITITNIYNDKSLTKTKFRWLKNAIGQRFIKLIDRDKLIIKFTDNLKIKNSETKPFSEKDDFVALVKTKYGTDRKAIEWVIENTKSTLDRYRTTGGKGRGKDELSIYKEESIKIFESISNLLLKSLDNPEQKFEWSETFDINGKNLDVKFWKLLDKHAQYRGFRVFEGERALLHPPTTNESNAGTYYKPVFPTTVESGVSHNRFAGEFDIKQIGATTTTDKSIFSLPKEDSLKLNALLAIAWRIFNTFEIMNRNNGEEHGTVVDKENEVEIIGILTSKFKSQINNIQVISDDFLTLDFIVNGEEWNFEITLDDVPSPKNVWDDDVIQNAKIGNLYSITAYTGHPLWKNIDSRDDFQEEVMLPLTIIIGHAAVSAYQTSRSDDRSTKIEDDKLESNEAEKTSAVVNMFNGNAGIMNE